MNIKHYNCFKTDFRPRQGNEGFVCYGKRSNLFRCSISVPVRGMRDLYEDEVIEEKTEKIISVPVRGMRDLYEYICLQRFNSLCISVPVRGMRDLY